MKFIFNPLSGQPTPVLNKAAEISYNPSGSGLVATTTQAAITEVQANVAAIPTPLTYKGTWNATTNIPALANTDTGKSGWLYQVQVAGTQNFGAGAISFDVGDKVVNDGTIWSKWDLTDAVTSVNGATGAVTVNAINQLTGDITAGPASGSQSQAATLATVNSNVGAFGSATQVAAVTVNAKGLVTAASNTAIQIAESQVTNLVSDLSTITTNVSNKAATDLSNLITTAINQNLVFNKTSPVIKGADAGTTSEAFAILSGDSTGANASASGSFTAKSGAKSAGSGNSGVASYGSGSVLSGASGPVTLKSGAATVTIGTSGPVTVGSGDTSASGTTGTVTVSSGNGATGASGDVTITTGTAGTTRGSVSVNNLVDPTNAQDAASKSYVDSRALNYITNFGASVNTTGWGTYADAAQATPTDGTGGSPTVTWTRSTSSPLRGVAQFLLTKDAANRQGEGASYNFSIDSADQGRQLAINFDYKIPSGTFASGDVTVWVYDVTNGMLLSQPSGNSIISTSIPSQQGQCTFQSAINSTNYRLIFHVTSTSASAYTLAFDNISVGPQVNASGSVDTDWAAYTPTYTGWGTVTNSDMFWRRQGPNIEIYGSYTAGTNTATEARMSLPTGLTTTSSPANLKIAGDITAAAAGPYVGFVLLEPSVTYVTFGLLNGSLNGLSKSNGNSWTNSVKIGLFAKFPIAGWGSNNVLSTSANTRAVVFNGTQATQALTANVTNLTLTASKDTVNGWSTNIYTVVVPGDYLVSGTGISSGASALYVSKNASTGSNFFATVGAGGASAGSILLPSCVVGDTIAIKSSSSSTITVGNIGIFLLQSPQQIAASESINARYFASATSISGSLATVVWTTKDYDTHNAMASGVYTCPAPGKYYVNTAVALSGTFVLNNTTVIEIQKNGVATSNLTRYIAAALTNDGIDIEDTINCNTGDQIRIQVSNSGVTPAIVSSNTRNFVSITRVGN